MERPLIHDYQRIYGSSPDIIASAPGRINIIGEHTDYNLGYVLPAAVHFRNFFLASKSEKERICVFSKNYEDEVSFSPKEIHPAPKKTWSDYIKGIFWVLREEGFPLYGINGFIHGDIPLDAGLSSSAALEICILKGLDSLFRLGLNIERMALLSQRVENDFIGVNSGLMDQYIALFAEKDKALFLDCETLKFKHVPFRLKQGGLAVLVFESGVRRELASSAYNKRRDESSKALDFFKKDGLKSYKDLSVKMLEKRKNEMGKVLYRRAKHVVNENRRVIKAVEALKNDDFEALGALLLQSHQSLRDDYQVSCPELDLLYEISKEFSGSPGARLTGAGFGGSGIVLVEKNKVKSFEEKVQLEAGRRGFFQPRFHEVEIGDGARIHS